MATTIPIRNLYYLYAYAWDQFHFTRRVATGEEVGPNAAPFFAKILIQGCQQIFRRGVGRTYQTHEEERPQRRGRIDVLKTVRWDSLRRGRVWCEFDELEFDGLANQLLKTTLSELENGEHLTKELKREIQKTVA